MKYFIFQVHGFKQSLTHLSNSTIGDPVPDGPILDPCGNSQPQVLTNLTGIITSPNYPQTYGYDKYCSWLIKTDEDYVIELTFDFFSLAYPYVVLIL